MTTNNFKPIHKIFENFFNQIGIDTTHVKKSITLKSQQESTDFLIFKIGDFNINFALSFEKHNKDTNYLFNKKIHEILIFFDRNFFDFFGYGNLKLKKYIHKVYFKLNWISLGLTIPYSIIYSLDASSNSSIKDKYISYLHIGRDNNPESIQGTYKSSNINVKDLNEAFYLRNKNVEILIPIYLFSKNNYQDYLSIFKDEFLKLDINNIENLDEKMTTIDMFYY